MGGGSLLLQGRGIYFLLKIAVPQLHGPVKNLFRLSVGRPVVGPGFDLQQVAFLFYAIGIFFVEFPAKHDFVPKPAPEPATPGHDHFCLGLGSPLFSP
jgi:hypothetical protein